MYYRLSIIILFVFLINCQDSNSAAEVDFDEPKMMPGKEIRPGAWQLPEYQKLLEGKRVGMVVNHTSTIGRRHTVDSLLNLGIRIECIFSPEHGFRGNADAGAHISDEKDPKTGITIVSLYGKKRQPSAEDLQNIDIIVFDIQDVGARFYTYISTLHYVMQACALYDKPLLLLDRPNPNGHYIDGPVREARFQSFVGMHPVPVVYGMTIGEYAQMINGEGWLENGQTCDLQVIHCRNYDHQKMYDLPEAPSPNLPNLRSILLYPSLCFFEGTPISIGRGTKSQFQVIGHPHIENADYQFTPVSTFGAAKPKLQDQTCYGVDLTQLDEASIFAERKIQLEYILDFFRRLPEEDQFFNANGWFDKLAGTTTLREQILSGQSEDEIRSSWQPQLEKFAKVRAKYLLYHQ